jgi:hypothetical protein
MSVWAKGVSRGVHNIAFLLSPDRFRAFDLLFFRFKGALYCTVALLYECYGWHYSIITTLQLYCSIAYNARCGTIVLLTTLQLYCGIGYGRYSRCYSIHLQ